MKPSMKRPDHFQLSTLIAGVIALFLPGCGEEPPPRPSAKAVPVPAAPKAEAKIAPDRQAVESSQAAANQALAAKVKSALAAEPGINTHRIDVVVKDGAVTLFGTAETRKQLEIAGKLTAAVAGVKSVDNKLAVVAGS